MENNNKHDNQNIHFYGNLIKQSTKALSINPFLHEYVPNFTHYEYISILALVLKQSIFSPQAIVKNYIFIIIV